MRPESSISLLTWLREYREKLAIELPDTDLTGCPSSESILENVKIPPEAKPHLLILLEWQAVFLVIYLTFSLSLPSKRNKWRDNVVHSLSYRLVTGIKAAIDLSSNGLELQNFQISRILAEDTQCLTLALLSDDFCDEFRSGNTVEGASFVWHKQLSRGKLRSKIVHLLKEHNPTIDFDDNTLYRKKEELVFGALVHPSYISGLMHKFLSTGESVGGLPWFRESPVPLGTRPYIFLQEGFMELAFAIEYRKNYFSGLSRRNVVKDLLASQKGYLTKIVRLSFGLVGAGYFANFISDTLWPEGWEMGDDDAGQ